MITESAYCCWDDSAEETMYETDCDHTFDSFEFGPPNDNGFIYCPYCGRQIVMMEGGECLEPGEEYNNYEE